MTRALCWMALCWMAPCLGLATLGCQPDRPATPTPEKVASETPSAAPSEPARAKPERAAPKRPAVADPDDWCMPHDVPESMCTLCNPELLPLFKAAGDYCEEHRLPESVCPQCNPLPPPIVNIYADPPAGDHGHAHRARPPGDEAPRRPAVADPDDWCPPHDVPESMCTLCNPELLPLFEAAGDYCKEHRLPESVCPQCNPLPPPVMNVYADPPPGDHDARAGAEAAAADHAGHARPPGEEHGLAPGTRIRFRDPAIAATAGITTVPAVRSGLAERIEAPARLDHDRNRLADIRAPIAGIVRAIEVDLGDRVEAGQPLFGLESARIGDLQARRRAARARLETARAEVRRQRELKANAITSERRVEAARREAAEARAALKAIESGLELGGAEADSGRFVVRAPIDGVVIHRPAVLGTYADETVSLATVADPARKWALVDVPEARAAALRPGLPVELRITGQPGAVRGTIDVVAAEIDPRTRAVTARATVPDPEGRLRAGAFARASVIVEASAEALTVPIGAIQQVGERSVVFVQTAAGVYSPRAVHLGRSDGRRVHVLGDVAPGAPVVVEGAFLLRTELMRDAIGAGCCEVEGPGE